MSKSLCTDDTAILAIEANAFHAHKQNNMYLSPGAARY